MVPFFVFVSVVLVLVYLVRSGRVRLPWSRSVKVLPVYGMVWKGGVWVVEPVRVTSIGVEAAPDRVYPLSQSQRVELPGMSVFVVTIDPLVLAEHEALERARRSILIGSLFKPGGDWMRWLQIAACVVPIAAAIWMTLSVGSLAAVVVQMRADVSVVRDVVSHPLVVAPPAP